MTASYSSLPIHRTERCSAHKFLVGVQMDSQYNSWTMRVWEGQRLKMTFKKQRGFGEAGAEMKQF